MCLLLVRAFNLFKIIFSLVSLWPGFVYESLEWHLSPDSFTLIDVFQWARYYIFPTTLSKTPFSRRSNARMPIDVWATNTTGPGTGQFGVGFLSWSRFYSMVQWDWRRSLFTATGKQNAVPPPRTTCAGGKYTPSSSEPPDCQIPWPESVNTTAYWVIFCLIFMNYIPIGNNIHGSCRSGVLMFVQTSLFLILRRMQHFGVKKRAVSLLYVSQSLYVLCLWSSGWYLWWYCSRDWYLHLILTPGKDFLKIPLLKSSFWWISCLFSTCCLFSGKSNYLLFLCSLFERYITETEQII